MSGVGVDVSQDARAAPSVAGVVVLADARELLVSVNIVQVRGVGLVERPPKGGKPRYVALSQSLSDALTDYIETEQLGSDEYLLKSPTDGGAIKPDYLTEHVGKLIVRAGLCDEKRKPLFHLHDLRRTAATLARERGVSIDVIRDQLGHGHERMTNRHYIRARKNPRLDEFAAAMQIGV
jgi:integrase